MVEASHAVTFMSYGITPDSGGPGRTRGGLGLHREWRLDADRGVLSTSFERFRIPPYGLDGGEPGAPGRLFIRRDGQVFEEASKLSGYELRQGDVVRLETSGGGGYGPITDRSADAIEADLKDGYVTPDAARRQYGRG